MLIHPPESVRKVLDQFSHEPSNSLTLHLVNVALEKFYGDSKPFKINLGYDYHQYLHVMFEFETEEDAVIFKLRYGA